MKKTKAKEIRLKTNDELRDQLLELQKERFNLRFQASSQQLTNTSRVREVRRDIALIKTIITEKAGV